MQACPDSSVKVYFTFFRCLLVVDLDGFHYTIVEVRVTSA